MTDREQKMAAIKFADNWKDRGDEKQETSSFWIELLNNVLGVIDPTNFIKFEKTVVVEQSTKFIDGYIPDTKVLIEQKSSNVKLNKSAVQSDGVKLTPYGQAFRYNNYLPYEEKAKWIIVSNFKEILIYNMNKPNNEPEQILLKDLHKEYYRLQFITDANNNNNLKKEIEISLKAGELVGKLYDAILKQYKNPNNPETLKSLNMLCVRLVFCLYAEDAGIFGKRDMFGNYLKQFNSKHIRKEIITLFKVLDTKPENRDQYMEDDLASFPYVNGGLFADENIEIPQFTDEIVDLLVNQASESFDWSKISPTIFGAVFESTLNQETRRRGGMHYTSIENIHKVIDPLFLDDLKTELENIKTLKVNKIKKKKLEDFRKKLSKIIFLDPASGSGNFLTETYLSLRRLENDALHEENEGQRMINADGDLNPIQVSIGQFYGIEINDFAVTVAKTALWIAESQMLHETEVLMDIDLNFLPLKSYANIFEANSLKIDWESVVPKDKLNYIIGNPPFVGANNVSKIQKKEIIEIFGEDKKAGLLDYVSCWYKKSADMMTGTSIRTALVSTNSITQGEQVAILWKNLFEQGVHIDFAYRTFCWDSEASVKAHVHCVIVGFSKFYNNANKKIFNNGSVKIVKNINGYLVESENILVERRKHPICNVFEISKGCQPTDGGNLIIEARDYDDFIKKEPKAIKYIKRLVGAKEYINGTKRFCLWLPDISPKELKSMPLVLDRVKKCKEMRLNSSDKATQKLAERPTTFRETYNPNTFVIIPSTSSENRKYIPIGFLDKDTISTNANLIIQNANIYYFGILTSNVHMAWMRTICGRLKSDYRYSKDIVYNNFPWPNPTTKQKLKIEQTAQAILDARNLYTDCSLADLYDETTMPSELRKAHHANDFAVMDAYGFDKKITESECVGELLKRYKEIVDKMERL